MTVVTTDLTGLRAAVDEAKGRYVRSNRNSEARHEAARAVLPGGNTRTVLHFDPFPLTFTRGDGPYLWSMDGARFTDFLGEFTAGIYGHSEQAILEAVRAALAGGISFGSSNGLEHRLAELICARFPSVDLVRFTNSGTEANLMALALAVHVTERRRVLVFNGAYHGSVLSFGDGPGRVNVPHDFVLGRYNDVERTRDLIHANRDSLAAILVEPMLGSGGCVPGTSEFLQMLRHEATGCGALLVFDEVMTSRLSYGGVQQLEGVLPDVTSLGKYLAGGMSFGAFGGRRDLMQHFDPSTPGALVHAGTFNNNVLSMSAGIAGLTNVLSEKALDELNRRGDRLRADINAVARRYDVALHASGRGSLMTIHPAGRALLACDGLTSAQELAKELLFFELLHRQQWIARRGMLTLSLPITDELCSGFVQALDQIIAQHAELLRGHLELDAA